MPEVSWTSDTCVGGVSGLVDLFRTTFVFEINSFGYFLSVPGIIDLQPGGGVDIRIAYSYSLYFSDQFSCIKFLNLTYGLKDIQIQSLNHFKSISGFLLLL